MSDETPAPRAEVKKLPRSRCTRCGLEGPKPMVVDGKCVNVTACQHRFNQAAKRRARGGK